MKDLVLYTQDVSERTRRYAAMLVELCPHPDRHRGEQDLFDLKADPYEMHNLSQQPEQRERVAALRKQLLDWWTRTGGGPLEVAKLPAQPPTP